MAKDVMYSSSSNSRADVVSHRESVHNVRYQQHSLRSSNRIPEPSRRRSSNRVPQSQRAFTMCNSSRERLKFAVAFQTKDPIPASTKFADIGVILTWRPLSYSPPTPRPFYNGSHTRDYPIVNLRHDHFIMASTYLFATGHLRHAHSNMASTHNFATGQPR